MSFKPILVADSGSTKTQWSILDNGHVTREVFTQGLNPNYTPAPTIRKIFAEELVPQLGRKDFSAIHFYGSGCSSYETVTLVKELLGEVLLCDHISVEHDLLAAARALCGKEEGIAAILGTGSNSCFFDGQKITDNVPSLGYIMGDEGSGSYLGKKLLRTYLYRDLPVDLSALLEKKYKVDKDEIIENVYRMPNAARFLASFCPFLSENASHPFIVQFLKESFGIFFKDIVMKYSASSRVPFHCTGSVGYVFA